MQAGEFVRILERHGLVQSMSRKGDCWDNAVAESFIGTLKAELLEEVDFKTRREAPQAIFEYVEGFYTRFVFIRPWATSAQLSSKHLRSRRPWPHKPGVHKTGASSGRIVLAPFMGPEDLVLPYLGAEGTLEYRTFNRWEFVEGDPCDGF